MYNCYPNIIDSLCNKTFKYRKGRVYFYNLYSKKLDQKHKCKVDQMYTMNEQFAKCFQYDTILPLISNGNPDICDCLNAHTDKYRKGKVDIQMICREEPLKYHYYPLPTVIDAMNAHCNKYKRGKIQLQDIYQPNSKYQEQNTIEVALSEAQNRHQIEIDLLGIA